MESITLENLPQDVKNALPEDAQKLYVAAYNSFLSNSHDQEAAARVAWQTIARNDNYVQGQDGKWQRMAEEDGGGHDRPLASAPQS